MYDIGALSLLVSAGLTLVVTGVTAAGWRHKALIWGLISLGASVILLALAWPLLGKASPWLVAQLSAMAAEPSSWFTLAMFVVALIVFSKPKESALPPGVFLPLGPNGVPHISTPELARDLRSEIGSLEARLRRQIAKVDDDSNARLLQYVADAHKVAEATQNVTIQLSLELKQLTDIMEIERGKMHEDLRRNESARLSQISRIQEEVEKVAKSAANYHWDLLYLLDWSVSRASQNIMREFLEGRPNFDKLNPPQDDEERKAAIQEMGRWCGIVRSYSQSLSFGGEIQLALGGARSDAEIAIRHLPPSDRPSTLDAFAFQDFFVAAFQCDRLRDVLQGILREMTNGERSAVLRLRERLTPHQQQHTRVS